MKPFIRAAILFVFLGILPLLLPYYYTGLLVRIMILIIFAMSLDILMGYTGLTRTGACSLFWVIWIYGGSAQS